MSEENHRNHRNVTCPDCGSKFNLADRLRSHIEAEVRSDLHASIRKEMEEELKERLEDEKTESGRQVASLEKKITNQAKEISGLREAKVELSELKESVQAEIREAKKEAIEAERKKLEEGIDDIVAKRLEEEAQKQRVLEGQVLMQRKELNELRRTKIELDDIKESRELEIQEERAKAVRELKIQHQQEMSEKISKRVKEDTAEKDLRIGTLELTLERQNSKIKDLEEQSRAKQSELEGEVLELAVEDVLRSLFPRDDVKDVKKGAYGADCEQTVRNPLGITCGKILWECKKHKRWNEDWIGTIRKNAADSNSDTMVIVTTAMPDGMENFGRYEDVFVCQYHELPVVAELLRFAVIKADNERMREEHMLSIQERVVEYVSGPEFANIMRMVIKAYQDFDDDLRREEQYMRKRWKARRGYLKNVIDSIMNMAGRLEQLGAGDYEVMMEIGGDQPPVNLLSESSEPEE